MIPKLVAPECDEIAHAIVVGAAEPDFKSLNRYYLTCGSCTPHHYVEVSRRDFKIARNAGTPLSRESIDPFNGTRRYMTLDKWIKKKLKSAKPKKRPQYVDTGNPHDDGGALDSEDHAELKAKSRRGRRKKYTLEDAHCPRCHYWLTFHVSTGEDGEPLYTKTCDVCDFYLAIDQGEFEGVPVPKELRGQGDEKAIEEYRHERAQVWAEMSAAARARE